MSELFSKEIIDKTIIPMYEISFNGEKFLAIETHNGLDNFALRGNGIDQLLRAEMNYDGDTDDYRYIILPKGRYQLMEAIDWKVFVELRKFSNEVLPPVEKEDFDWYYLKIIQ